MNAPEPETKLSLEKTRELLTIPYAAEILQRLLQNPPYHHQELQNETCNQEASKKALDCLIGEGLVKVQGEEIKLTSAGAEVAEGIDLIGRTILSAKKVRKGPKLQDEYRNTREHDVSFHQFLAELEELTSGYPKLYIFRGQPKAEYHLEPAALRHPGKGQLESLVHAIEEGRTELYEKSFTEHNYCRDRMNRSMRLFDVMAERQGLDMPSVMSEGTLMVDALSYFMHVPSVDDGENGNHTTHGSYLRLAAIAQHYGFPTLLLDWSLDPLCALYFATQRSLEALAGKDKKYKLEEGRFSVWCLRADIFKDEPGLSVYSYNHHTNRNQIAQRGVFTYVYRKDLDDEKTVLELVDGLDVDKMNINGPVLYKFNIPYKDVLEAMDYLKRMFKTSDTFFPGYEGIVRAMKDHANYQIVKKRIDDEL